MLGQLVIAMAISALFFIIVKEKPSRPPSQVATAPYEGLDFCLGFKSMKDNRNFLLQTIAMAIPVGACTSIPILMSNLFDPFGFTTAEIAFLGL